MSSFDPTTDEALVYGLPLKARCLVAQAGETEKNCFLVGSLSLREENELHLIEVKEDTGRDHLDVACTGHFSHPKEIWHIAPSPSDPLLLYTCYNTGQNEFRASLWRIDDQTLVETSQLAHSETIKCVLWHPVEDEEESRMVLSLDDNTIKLWDIEAGGSSAKETGTITLGELQRLTTGCWNPNNTNEVVAANDTRVQGWDLRSLKETFSIPKAHSHFVRDLDYNPNKLYLIATGGDDCYVKFWDTRKSQEPLKVVKGHSHWVWNVEYNKFRDQLVLSSSTDSSVNLWKIATLSSSSEPLGIDDYRDPADTAGREDYLIKSYDVHEESVYSVAWGCYEASPYVFASLSYDGRVVINQVPEEEIARIQDEM